MTAVVTIRAAIAPPLLAVLTLSGCASTLSGVGGVDGYACKAPEGAMCTSVSGVYANSRQGTPKPTKAVEKAPASSVPAIYGASSIAPGVPAGAASASIRSTPRVLRLWIAPWEDADGDLHEESLVHMVVDTGRWLIEHVRPAPRSRIEGVAPPTPPATPAAPEPATKAPVEAPQAPTRFPLSPGGFTSGSDAMPQEP